MAPAADAVLYTPELLEIVLLHVDLRTLLLAVSRVSRSWHAVLAASLPLQRMLFLHPIDDPAPSEDEDDEPDTDDDEPDTGEDDEPNTGEDDEPDTDDDGSEYLAEGKYIYSRPKAQNPFLRPLFPAWFENTCSFEPQLHTDMDPVLAFPATATMGYRRFRELPLYKTSLESGSGDDNPFLRPCASWRRMLVSQPACRTVIANVGEMSDTYPLGMPQVHQHDDGLRMGELYDMTLRHCARHSVSGFLVVWREGGYEGYMDVARHLRRMVGNVPFLFERSYTVFWRHEPDLVVQMSPIDGGPWPGELARESDGEVDGKVDGEDLGSFWDRCGSNAFNVFEDKSQVQSTPEREVVQR